MYISRGTNVATEVWECNRLLIVVYWSLVVNEQTTRPRHETNGASDSASCARVRL